MIVKALVENVSYTPDFHHKHGLSLFVETKNHKLLFDVGPNDLFVTNAKKLGVDLEMIDTVIISHGHSDHGGGLNTFLDLNKKAKVYINKKAFIKHYHKIDKEYVSISIHVYKRHLNRIVFVDDNYRIDDELFLFSSVKGRKYFSEANAKLYQKIDGKLTKDDFGHEQNLIINEEDKIVMISGCCHNGIINTLDRAKELSIEPTHIISGLHLYNPANKQSDSDDTIFGIAECLSKLDTVLYTCHCTGYNNYEKMKTVLHDKIDYLSCGRTINI